MSWGLIRTITGRIFGKRSCTATCTGENTWAKVYAGADAHQAEAGHN